MRALSSSRLLRANTVRDSFLRPMTPWNSAGTLMRSS